MLTSVSSPTLQACSSGGRVIKQGLDNGDGSGTAQNGILEAGEVDYTTTYCSNFVLTRMADINSGSGTSYPGFYAGLTVMGTRLYFDADDGSSGYELWAHETTNSSTWQVADIFSGSSSSFNHGASRRQDHRNAARRSFIAARTGAPSPPAISAPSATNGPPP